MEGGGRREEEGGGRRREEEAGGGRREEGEVHFVDNFVSGPVQTCKRANPLIVIW